MDTLTLGKMVMNEEEKESLKEIISDVLNQGRKITDETHKLHHDYIQHQMEKDIRRQAMWKKVVDTWIGALAIAAISGVAWVGNLILEYFKNGGHH